MFVWRSYLNWRDLPSLNLKKEIQDCWITTTLATFVVTFRAILEWASNCRKIQRLGKFGFRRTSQEQQIAITFYKFHCLPIEGTMRERRLLTKNVGIDRKRGDASSFVEGYKEWRPDIDDRLKTVLSFSDPMDLLWRTNDASYLASGLHSLCWLPAQK